MRPISQDPRNPFLSFPYHEGTHEALATIWSRKPIEGGKLQNPGPEGRKPTPEPGQENCASSRKWRELNPSLALPKQKGSWGPGRSLNDIGEAPPPAGAEWWRGWRGEKAIGSAECQCPRLAVEGRGLEGLWMERVAEAAGRGTLSAGKR